MTLEQAVAWRQFNNETLTHQRHLVAGWEEFLCDDERMAQFTAAIARRNGVATPGKRKIGIKP